MFQKLFGGSRFLKRMNTLLEIYACSHNASATYRELLRLKPLDPDRGGESALRTEPGVSFIRHEKIPRSQRM